MHASRLPMTGRYLPAAAALAIALAATPLRADIADDEVLVVYNSASADGSTLAAAYLAAHPAIPAANVLDLAAPSLLVADLTHAQFVTDIRNPVRSYLAAPGSPQPEDIVAIVLIRPFPHRILDTDNATVGDTPSPAGNELLAGDATYASVDAELVLLWQDLDTGESGGTMDSKSDNMIDNPYHQNTAPIDTFTRAAIASAKSFSNQANVVWRIAGTGSARLTPGDIYLVCRIDAANLAGATALIDRSQDIAIDRTQVKILLDEYDLAVADDLDDDPLFTSGDPFLAGDDYEDADAILTAAGWHTRYDDTFDFIDANEETAPLIAYASYGENHDIGGAGENPPGTATYIDNFNFAPGAIFNTLESYNGRAFNGLGTLFGLEQAADFFAAGGTFAIGNVFEPFTFPLADNAVLLPAMLIERRTWGEAAYAAIPALSWQHLVLGDPLSRIHVLGDIDDDGDIDLADYNQWTDCFTGPENGPYPAGCRLLDFDNDGDIDLTDFHGFQLAFNPW